MFLKYAGPLLIPGNTVCSRMLVFCSTYSIAQLGWLSVPACHDRLVLRGLFVCTVGGTGRLVAMAAATNKSLCS